MLEVPTRTFLFGGGVDESGMPRFSTAFELPAPGDAWSPEAMITWMYERCARRHGIAMTDERRQLYAGRMAVLRGVMQGCRSTDAELRLEASRMTRSMTDISEDEKQPLSYRLSTAEFCTTLDEAERAVSSWPIAGGHNWKCQRVRPLNNWRCCS